jgi:acyl dehydratase
MNEGGEMQLQDTLDYRMATLDRFVGRDFGASEWLTIDQALIDQFAECTGDRQWVHVDVDRATRETLFGGTIAHGYLVLSLVAPFSFEVGLFPADASQVINYGADRIRFIAPLRSGQRMRDRVTLLSTEGKGNGRALITSRHTIEIEGEAKPAMIAEILTMLISA